MLKEEVGKRLRQIRRHFGYQQDRMAQLIEISKVTYGKNERGLHLPETLTLVSLHKQLGVSVEWLLFNRGSMFWKGEPQEKSSVDFFTQEVEEMIDLMKRIPLLRHSVMMHYQQFKIDHKELLQEAQEKT
jgi:DNA-binding XRE family transcriptional regulator